VTRENIADCAVHVLNQKRRGKNFVLRTAIAKHSGHGEKKKKYLKDFADNAE
jgi:hypothetical protein